MIYLLHGTDIIKSRKKMRILLDSILTKKPNISFIRIDIENFNESRIEEFVGSRGLFENKYIIVFDNLFKDEDIKETLLKNLKKISESQNIFIFLEEKLNKTQLLKFEKYAEKIQSFRLGGEVSKSEKFNTFSLADALGTRDKKQLWVLYQKAKLNNVSDEEIHGKLFWQIKSMLLASSASSAEEAELNPFVFRKSRGFLKNYTEKELKKLSFSLTVLYHDTRRGVHEMDNALERFVLEI